MQDMAQLDLQFANLVKDHADFVTHVSLGFGLLESLLVAAHIYVQRTAINLEAQIYCVGFAQYVSFLGVLIGVLMIGALACVSKTNSDKADDLTTQYKQLAAEVG